MSTDDGPPLSGSGAAVAVKTSDLSDDDLRSVCEILEELSPDVLASALTTFRARQMRSTEGGDGDAYATADEVDCNATEPPPVADETAEQHDTEGQGEELVQSELPSPPQPQQPPTATAPADESAVGCYLLYDGDAGKLMLHYSRTVVPGAIGFWSPGPGRSIQEFKFQRNFGRAELIGNCASGAAGRKNYYSGWCQFVRAARAMGGPVWIHPRGDHQQGLDVDVYVYNRGNASAATECMSSSSNGRQTVKVPEGAPFDVSRIDAVACLPRHAEFFEDVATVDLNHWLTEGSTIGAASRFADAAAPTAASVVGGEKKEKTAPRSPTSTVETPPAANCAPPRDEMPQKEETQQAESESRPQVEPFGPTPQTKSAPPATASADGGEGRSGCYLLYDGDSGKLMLHYSRTEVPGAIGFWSPGAGRHIQPFKFKRNSGRAELIGNCASGVAGRKNYYSGWCQFVRAARAMGGPVWIYPRPEGQQGLDVDVYVYYKDSSESCGRQTIKLPEAEPVDVSRIDAVACLPKHTEFFEEVTIDLNRWLTVGGNIGATSRFE